MQCSDAGDVRRGKPSQDEDDSERLTLWCLFTPAVPNESMRRRAVLAAVAGGAGLSGCLSRGGGSPPESTPPPTGGEGTPVRHTADGVEATFRVVDAHGPTADDANATFDDERVTVTGTANPSGCRRPTLRAVSYDPGDGVVHVEVGTESPYGPTATVVCDDASFDYRCVLTVERGRPATVELVHDYREKDDRTFVLERG